jgi:hypothetical protein
MKRIVFMLIAFSVYGGCFKEHRNNNSLAIMELVYKDRTEIVFLPNDYGFLIQWIDHEEPEFYLYDKPASKIQMTSVFFDFMAVLQGFPNGVKVDRIRGCGITEQGMPEDYKNRLHQIIKAKEFSLTDLDDGNYGVCSCETSAVRMFTTVNN